MDEKQVKVVLIDDEADFTTSMSFWLKSKGYNVFSANSGQEGIELIKKENPNIVFMDLNMPVMDGAETLKHIREFNKDLPVVMISAYVDDKRIIEARAYGFSGVFFKGKDFEEGLVLLEAALRTHKNLKK
jgi:CheY-like chemotaxis protein